MSKGSSERGEKPSQCFFKMVRELSECVEFIAARAGKIFFRAERTRVEKLFASQARQNWHAARIEKTP
jgi:hypothetical protein